MKRFCFAVLASAASLCAADVAIDAVVVGPQVIAATSITWTHTCAPNTALYVALEDNNPGTTSVSANGNAMTLVAAVSGGHNLSVWQMGGCSGAQTIQAFEAYGFLSGTSVSLVNAIAQPNAQTVAGAGAFVPAGTNYPSSVTSTVNRCLTLLFLDESFGQGSIFSAGSGTTMLVSGTGSAQRQPEMAAGSAIVGTAGTSTLNVTSNATQTVWSIMIAVAPAGGFVANPSVIAVE
jgi:hypothetical protein